VPSGLAVVSLSGPRSFLGADAGAAAPRLRVPLMCVAATQDMGGDFLDAARTTCAQNGAAGPRQLVTIQGAGHGTQLVSVPDSPASQAIDALLARHAMP
jgi:pimeloyl-ACP methyl ester carboxylesterase